jgi:poly(3-hydroxybutyrate) depolymerase
MSIRLASRSLVAIGWAVLATACGTETPNNPADTGGSSPGTGGATGGNTSASGGTSGGSATGGVTTGGVSTGGRPTGGVSSGGVSTGGKATGGLGTGGKATGGGGAATGGTTTGTGGSAGGAKPTPGCGLTTFPASGTYTIDVSGTSRSYIIKVPSGFNNTKPHRLIMAWHGLGMTADQTANGSFPANEGHYYELEPLSGGQAIFTSGQGLGGSGQTGWPNTNGQDVAFARALVAYLRNTYCIDDSRIFSVGKSYGGNFTNTLGCEMGDVFRAIVPQSSWLGGTTKSCVGQPAVWIAHGRTDDVIQFSRGEAARDQWLKTNHCGTTTTPWEPTLSQNNCVAYDGCDAGKPVVWCPFDGAHVIQNWGPPSAWKFLMQF